jgi:general secretion pathway protein E/type IV pilus assembly protein PilB
MLRLDHAHFDRELRPPLGALLVRKGLLAKEQLDEALAERAQTGELLGQVLLRRGWIFEDELARVLAEQHALDFVNLRTVGVDRRLLPLIPAESGRRLRVVPVRLVGAGDVLTAVADPNDRDGMAELAALAAERLRTLRLVVAEPSAIAEIWERFTRGAALV